MFLRFLGKSTELRLGHPINVPHPMNETLSGIVIVRSFEHRLKAQSPILIVLLGIEIETKFAQFLKAPSPILVVPSGMTKFFKS